MRDVSDLVAAHSTRRAFLGRLGAALVGIVGGGVVAGLEDDAQAHHFCGHIASTGSCPHPTGLPRIDAQGYPLRAADGRRVDDLGRLVDTRGRPVDGAGRLLRDAAGRPLAPAARSRVCQDAIPARYGIAVHQDGAWYRCCGGRVRKLVDCCSTSRTRINGDASVTGYCKAGRRVFCVMYFDTNVPC